MKKFKKILIYLIIIIIISSLTFYIGRQIGLNTDTSTTTITTTEVIVGTQTISQTLTTSGEIETQNEEELELSTSKYFKTMCVEEDDIVSEGDNILQYSDGTYLTAPYDCVIESYSVPDTGEQATSSNYVKIQDMENLKVTISVSESEILSISEGQEVLITLTADDSITYTGELVKISSTGTYQSSGTTFTAYVNFENDGNAKIGMSVSCEITLEEKTDVIAVPIEAVSTDGDTKYVTVVEDGKTTEVEITTGLSDDSYVEVTSGLEGGETIQITTETTESSTRSSSSDSSETGSFGGGDMDMSSFSGDFDFSDAAGGGAGGMGMQMQMPN